MICPYCKMVCNCYDCMDAEKEAERCRERLRGAERRIEDLKKQLAEARSLPNPDL